MHHKDIRSAAVRILSHLARRNGGRLPASFRAARRLTLHGYDVDCRAVFKRPGFTAEIVEDAEGDWTLFYNGRHSEERRLRYVIHELAEYLALADFPTLFDGLPGSPICRYDGRDNPRDVRHRVAFLAEQMFLKQVAHALPHTEDFARND